MIDSCRTPVDNQCCTFCYSSKYIGDSEVDQKETNSFKTELQSPEDKNGEHFPNDDDGYLECEDSEECSGGWV